MFKQSEEAAPRLTLSESDRIERRGVMAALDASQCLVWFGPDGRIVDVNMNAQNLLAARAEVLKTLDFATLLGEKDIHQEYHSRHWLRIVSGHLKSEERSIYTVNGTELWCSISYAAIMGERGVARRVLAIIIDLAPWSWRPKDCPSRQI